jgi:hypothetical protein
MENNMAISQKLKHNTALRSSNPATGDKPREMESVILKRYLTLIHVH